MEYLSALSSNFDKTLFNSNSMFINRKNAFRKEYSAHARALFYKLSMFGRQCIFHADQTNGPEYSAQLYIFHRLVAFPAERILRLSWRIIFLSQKICILPSQMSHIFLKIPFANNACTCTTLRIAKASKTGAKAKSVTCSSQIICRGCSIFD